MDTILCTGGEQTVVINNYWHRKTNVLLYFCKILEFLIRTNLETNLLPNKRFK